MKNIRNVYFMPWVKRQFEKAKAEHPELGIHINDLRDEIGYLYDPRLWHEVPVLCCPDFGTSIYSVYLYYGNYKES